MTEQPEQPTLTDGEITLRPWRDEDVEDAVAGHDDTIAHWFGWPPEAVTAERQRQAIADWRAAYADGRSEVAFAVEEGGVLAGSVDV
ncbi:MAG: GNAT family protein, partial [Nocardioides sp.]